MSKRIVRNIFENVNDENIALTSEISTKLNYKDLKSFIDRISKQLAGNGLSNKDRAAIVLPNGPYMASSFLAISSYMSAAPLNPSYKSEEYEFYLKDLNPKIVLVEKNSENPVVDVAKKLKIELCEINPEKDGPSGIFNIYEVDLKTNEETQLTDSKEESFFARGYSPTTGEVIYSADKGGNENSHIYIIRDGKKIDLTPGKNTKASFFGWTDDESEMYVISNSRDPRFFDLYKMAMSFLAVL